MLEFLAIIAIVILTFREMLKSTFFDSLYDHGRGFLGWVGAIFAASAVSALISIAPIIVGIVIGSLPARQGVIDHTYPLVALREKDGFAGQSYFLGVGHVESEEYYFWYRQNPDGSISGGKTLREEGVNIYPTQTAAEILGQRIQTKPTMTTYKTQYKNPNVSKWLWIVGFDTRSDTEWCPTFSIPADSIQQGYTL